MKMSFWSTVVTVSVATALLVLVTLFAVRTTPAASAENAQPAAAATASAPATGATADRAATLESAFRQREAEYQAQIQQVSTLLQERQTLYSQQLTELGSWARARNGRAPPGCRHLPPGWRRCN